MYCLYKLERFKGVQTFHLLTRIELFYLPFNWCYCGNFESRSTDFEPFVSYLIDNNDKEFSYIGGTGDPEIMSSSNKLRETEILFKRRSLKEQGNTFILGIPGRVGSRTKRVYTNHRNTLHESVFDSEEDVFTFISYYLFYL